jgi:hypothetical protein
MSNNQNIPNWVYNYLPLIFIPSIGMETCIILLSCIW